MLFIKDNSNASLEPEQKARLSGILDQPLLHLLKEHGETLFVFPHSLTAGLDGRNKDKACYILTTHREGDAEYARAGNLAGFISYNGEQVSITSRFSSGEGSDQQDYLLHYMLQKVLSINITQLPHSRDDERIFDFLPYLFPSLLNRAMRQGLYKEYRREQHNDARLRGSIDVARHLRQNLPFMGKIAYNTREFSHDNPVTQLVRHTIEYLSRSHAGILTANAACRENVATIVEATPRYNEKERRSLLRQKTRQHPYYTEYGPLQKLCRSILLHETLSYGRNEKKVNGVLFDVAWLWEEYLHTLLEPLGFTHPSNIKQTEPIWLTQHESTGRRQFARYPDFYRKVSQNPPSVDIVADAKYKFDFTDSDIHQVITYMFSLKAKTGLFLLPVPAGETPTKETPTSFPTDRWQLGGYGDMLASVKLSIPPSKTGGFADFCKRMKEQERNLADYLSPSPPMNKGDAGMKA